MLRAELLFVVLANVLAGTPAQEKEAPQKPPPLELVEATESSQNRISRHLPLAGKASAIDAAWMGRDYAGVVGHADKLLEANCEDFTGHALRYLAALELKKDRQQARKFANASLKTLAAQPLSLALFVNRALFVDPTPAEYQMAVMATTPLVSSDQEDNQKLAPLRIAHVSALLGSGNVRQGLRECKTIVDDLKRDPKDLMTLVHAICDLPNGRAIGATARQVLTVIEKTHPVDQELRMLQYRVLHDLEGKTKQARALGVKIINEVAASQGSLNNWVWYLMTRRDSADKYPTLALLGARVMQSTETLSGGNKDTVALALFKNGLLAEAFEVQEDAVASGGASVSMGIRRRLEIYKRAVKSGKRRKSKR